MVRIARQSEKQPILVTGTHYSATTLVGDILSRNRDVHYIHEPFNITNSLAHDHLVKSTWFSYIEETNEEPYVDRMRDILYGRGFVGHAVRKVARVREPKDLLRLAKYVSDCAARRLIPGRPLVKDPIALLSSRWLAARFDMRVVLTVRHPCAFVESIKRKSSHFPFAHLLNQPRLMKTWLRDYRDVIEDFSKETKPLVEQGALLWLILNHVAFAYAAEDERFMVVRHEDIVTDPVASFAGIAEHAGIEFEDRMKQRIDKLMSPANPVEPNAKGRGAYVRRDPKASISKWRTALSTAEIEHVLNVTAKLYDEAYGREAHASTPTPRSESRPAAPTGRA